MSNKIKLKISPKKIAIVHKQDSNQSIQYDKM